MRLYETHLPVRNTEESVRFYCGIVGLEFGYRDPQRDILFLFIGEKKQSMLGLWGPTTALGAQHHPHHFAISVPLEELLHIGSRLTGQAIETYDFEGHRTTEPSVIGWMPSAQLYFDDPDGHSVEFIALLDDEPDATFIGSLSAWKSRR